MDTENILSQNKWVAEVLLGGGVISGEQARTKFGITRLAARIGDLKNSGRYPTIKSRRVKGKNRFGKDVWYAEYYIDPCPECGTINQKYHCRCRKEVA